MRAGEWGGGTGGGKREQANTYESSQMGMKAGERRQQQQQQPVPLPLFFFFQII